MAGPSVIGALRVVLGADTAALDKGLKDAQGSLAAFGTNFAKAGVAAAAAFAVAAAGIAVAVKHVINNADKLGKMSQKIGVPVEELSALKFAADLSDVSLDSLGKSLGKLSKAMVEAAAKPTSDAANAFKALGVSVTNSDGTLKSSSQVMGDIAGKFEGLKDGAGKTAVAMALFGKSGAEMIPLLNSGKAGLKEMTDEAKQLGIVINTKTAKSAEAFNDNLKRLSAVKEAIFIQLAAQLLPTLQKLSEIFVQNAKDGNLAKISADAISAALLGLTQGVMTVSLWWRRLGVEYVAFRQLMETDVFSGKVTENWNKFQETLAETERQQLSLKASFEDDPIGNSSNLPILTANLGAANKAQGDLNYSLMGGKTAVDSFIESTKKSLAAQAADTASVGAAIGLKEKLRVVLQANELAMLNQVKMTPTLTAQITALGLAAEQSAIKMAGMQMTQESLEPWELYAQKLTRIQQLYDAGAISAETYGRAMQNAADTAGVSWQTFGGTIASTMGDASRFAASFAKDNKAMAVLSKAFGIGQAIINTQMAVMKALAFYGPTPWGYAAAGLAAASGAMAVATISMQKFATGGSFEVGGSGGVDSQMVPFMATPGERVHVEQNKYGESGGGTVNLTLNGRNFGRDDVRELLGTVKELVSDGYRLNLVAA